MSQSLIDLILSDATPHQFIGCLTDGARRELVAELRELVSKTTTPTPPRDAAGIQGASHPRRLREYKGVTYDPSRSAWGSESFGEYAGADAVSRMIAQCSGMTDADHAALLALRDDPWEPVETLEDAFKSARTAWFEESTGGEGYVTFICTRLRAHLATHPQPITPEQAVAVLVENGAKRCQFFDVHGNGLVLTRGGLKGELRVSVLVLPEPTP